MSNNSTFRTIEVKLYPTKQQVDTLSSLLRTCCRIYNQALEHRIKTYKRRKESPSLYDQQKLLTVWRSRIEAFRMVPAQFERDALRRVDKGMKGFFRRCKSGNKKKGFPRFKSSRRWRSMESLLSYNYVRDGAILIPGIGEVSCRGLKIDGKQKSLNIIRRESGWYAQLIVSVSENLPQIEPKSFIGIDIGLKSFASFSNGEKIENPRLFKQSERKLRIAQRRACRKVKGSNNRHKAYRRVARIHERIQAQRKDFTHQESRKIVNQFDFISIENLNIKGLASGIFAKSVNDAAWAIFTFCLLYKAANAGKQVVKVDPRSTSQTCPDCGAVKGKTLSERVHSCECGAKLCRDVAAARVILARGLAVAGLKPVEGTTATIRDGPEWQVGPMKQEDLTSTRQVTAGIG